MLTNTDIYNLVPGVKIILYKDLYNVNNIESIIPPAGLVILTPGTSEYNGHWICLFIDGIIYYFDPFGNYVDESLEYDVNNTLSNNEMGRLSLLLEESPLPVDFNNWQVQSKISENCGYWVVARLLMRDEGIITTDDFYEFWRLKPDSELPDNLVKYWVENY